MSSQLNVPAAPPKPAGTVRGPALPDNYGETRLVLMARDPRCLQSYWEIAPDTWREVERLFGPEAGDDGEPVLRFYLGGNDGKKVFDVDVLLEAPSWYVRLPFISGRCRAELGLALPDGRFALLAMSNEVWVPAGKASGRQDEKWALLKGEWERLYELSGGGQLGVGAGSIDAARAMAQHWEFLGAVSSWPGGLPAPRGETSGSLHSTKR